MYFEQDSQGRRLPRLGTTPNLLGVRVPPAPRADVRPDTTGSVGPGPHGLSVAPSPDDIPSVLMPERLRLGGRGSPEVHLFRFGEGPFVAGEVGPDLALRPTSPSHGVIHPRRTVHIDEFQQHLAATRSGWHDEG